MAPASESGAPTSPVARRLAAQPHQHPARDRAAVRGGLVAYRSVSRPLVELSERNRGYLLPSTCSVRQRLRTFDAHLQRTQQPLPRLFTSTGTAATASRAAGWTRTRCAVRRGTSSFENDDGKADPVSAEKLDPDPCAGSASPLSCSARARAGSSTGYAEDTFASVATALVRAGVRGVVTMAYSRYDRAAPSSAGRHSTDVSSRRATSPRAVRSLVAADARPVEAGVRRGSGSPSTTGSCPSSTHKRTSTSPSPPSRRATAPL